MARHDPVRELVEIQREGQEILKRIISLPDKEWAEKEIEHERKWSSEQLSPAIQPFGPTMEANFGQAPMIHERKIINDVEEECKWIPGDRLKMGFVIYCDVWDAFRRLVCSLSRLETLINDISRGVVTVPRKGGGRPPKGDRPSSTAEAEKWSREYKKRLKLRDKPMEIYADIARRYDRPFATDTVRKAIKDLDKK